VTEPAVLFDRVSIVFGDRPTAALPAMDAGRSRGEVQRETGQILGVHDCSLEVAEGEILVLMGLSGSGKSTLPARRQRPQPGHPGRRPHPHRRRPHLRHQG
jgi:glycine betaine/proline transport system ATP-binding protein